MTHRNKGSIWRAEIVSGTHGDKSWVGLRDYHFSEDGEKFGFNHIASAETIEELIADFREWLAVAEAYQEQEQK